MVKCEQCKSCDNNDTGYDICCILYPKPVVKRDKCSAYVPLVTRPLSKCNKTGKKK